MAAGSPQVVTCPGCGLINPPNAVRCDCGVDLRAQSRGAIDKVRRAQLERPLRRRALGIWLMVFGSMPGLIVAVAGSPAALICLLNLPFLVGLYLTLSAQQRVRALRELESRTELPQAKTVRRE